MRIKEAIKHYNSVKGKEEQKMTQIRLAEITLPGENVSTGTFYMSMWSSGKYYQNLKGSTIKAICEACRVDADFLFRGVVLSKENIENLDACGMFKVLNCTGMTPNQLLKIRKMKTN